jgi:hypothetical protein
VLVHFSIRVDVAAAAVATILFDLNGAFYFTVCI